MIDALPTPAGGVGPDADSARKGEHRACGLRRWSRRLCRTPPPRLPFRRFPSCLLCHPWPASARAAATGPVPPLSWSPGRTAAVARFANAPPAHRGLVPRFPRLPRSHSERRSAVGTCVAASPRGRVAHTGVCASEREHGEDRRHYGHKREFELDRGVSETGATCPAGAQWFPRDLVDPRPGVPSWRITPPAGRASLPALTRIDVGLWISARRREPLVRGSSEDRSCWPPPPRARALLVSGVKPVLRTSLDAHRTHCRVSSTPQRPTAYARSRPCSTWRRYAPVPFPGFRGPRPRYTELRPRRVVEVSEMRMPPRIICWHLWAFAPSIRS